ncbi:MAG: hypothetical protein JJ931_15195 [Henriciella sp.]|nr:hypothetical protein [Henriciella sp.]MBO6696752.1 hypothetical protein [Henriciella sp.]
MSRNLVGGLITAIVLLVAACSPSGGEGKPLFVSAVDYADFTPAPGCTADVDDATYRACIDPRALYAAAIESATQADNPLMVIWGFEECPYCKKFAAEEMSPENPRLISDFVGNTLTEAQRASLPDNGRDFQISVLHLHVRAPMGEALAEQLGVTDIARSRGWHRVWSPFVTFTRPGSHTFVAQTQFQQGEKPCNYVDDFAISLEQIGYIPADESKERPMCAAA